MKKFQFKSVLELIMALFMAAILVVVWLQVLSRFFLPAIPKWTGEEATTFLMIWMVTSGAAVSMARGTHITVDLIFQYVHGKAAEWIRRLVYVLEIVFLTYFSVIGFRYIWGNRKMSTPRLHIPYWSLQGCIPLFMAVMDVYAVCYLIKSFRKAQGKEEK